MIKANYDSLNTWRKENGMKTSDGEVVKYEGGSEYDYTAEAIKTYIENDKKKEKKDDKSIER